MAFAPLVTGTGVIGWGFLSRTREKQQAVFEKSPTMARDTARFAAEIQSIQTSEQLMDNRDLLRVALGAFGLDDDLNNRAFIKKVLDSDLTDSKSLANRLADKRYFALAQSFNFAGTGGRRSMRRPQRRMNLRQGSTRSNRPGTFCPMPVCCAPPSRVLISRKTAATSFSWKRSWILT